MTRTKRKKSREADLITWHDTAERRKKIFLSSTQNADQYDFNRAWNELLDLLMRLPAKLTWGGFFVCQRLSSCSPGSLYCGTLHVEWKRSSLGNRPDQLLVAHVNCGSLKAGVIGVVVFDEVEVLFQLGEQLLVRAEDAKGGSDKQLVDSRELVGHRVVHRAGVTFALELVEL
jgi:hypothetical protein